MEDRMDLPLGGNTEAECHAGNDFFDLKWACPLHLEFLRSVHVEVGGFQPDLVSHFPRSVFGEYPLLHFLLG